MFLIIEGFLYFLIVISQLSWIKYFSIVVCFFYCLYKQRGYHIFFLILLADYILLWGDYYKLGIALFMLVQCLYHRQLANDFLFGIIKFFISKYLFISVCLCFNESCKYNNSNQKTSFFKSDFDIASIM